MFHLISERGIDCEGFTIQSGTAAAGIQLQGNGAELQRTGFLPPVEITVAVKIIAEHRMSKSCQMCPDLMRLSGDELHLQQAVLLAAIFTLACLTTCVGLITSISQYFSTLFKNIRNSKIFNQSCLLPGQ